MKRKECGKECNMQIVLYEGKNEALLIFRLVLRKCVWLVCCCVLVFICMQT